MPIKFFVEGKKFFIRFVNMVVKSHRNHCKIIYCFNIVTAFPIFQPGSHLIKCHSSLSIDFNIVDLRNEVEIIYFHLNLSGIIIKNRFN